MLDFMISFCTQLELCQVEKKHKETIGLDTDNSMHRLHRFQDGSFFLLGAEQLLSHLIYHIIV